MPVHPNSLKNLKKFTKEGARLGQQKGVETRLRNKEMQKELITTAKNFAAVIDKIPTLSSIDVVRMCIHMALQKEDYETAARWAEKLAEYEKPKLSRVEVKGELELKDLSDEELEEKMKELGLK